MEKVASSTLQIKTSAYTLQKRQSNPDRQAIFLLVAGAIVLLAIPCVALWGNWQWDPSAVNSVLLRCLYTVSETAGILAVVFFCAVLGWHLRLTLLKSCLLLAILGAITFVGLGVKTATKDVLQESRPYVVWLEKNDYIAPNQFYALPHKSRFVSEQDLSNTPVPTWLQQYWSENTSYSFPSGHGFFAAEWALIILALLWRKKAYLTITLTFMWAMVAIASRLYLGMHWPQDIIPSCMLAFVLVGAGNWAWNKWVFSSSQTPHA